MIYLIGVIAEHASWYVTWYNNLVREHERIIPNAGECCQFAVGISNYTIWVWTNSGENSYDRPISGFTLTDRHSTMAKKKIGKREITRFCQFGETLNCTYAKDLFFVLVFGTRQSVSCIMIHRYTTFSEMRRHIAQLHGKLVIRRWSATFIKIYMAVSPNFAKGIYFLIAKLVKAIWIWLNSFFYL